jgi:hypothetical protein
MNRSPEQTITVSRTSHFIRMTMLSVLRMVIGWHFLYEGGAKLLIPGWSSVG